jgi:hypothetical protein
MALATPPAEASRRQIGIEKRHRDMLPVLAGYVGGYHEPSA